MKTFFNKFNHLFLFLLVLVMSTGQMWGDTYPQTVWSVDVAAIDNAQVTITKGRSSDAFVENTGVSWAAQATYPSRLNVGGSNAATITAQFKSDLTMSDNHVLRVYWGGTSARNLTLTINTGDAFQIGTTTGKLSQVVVSEYEFTSDVKLNKFVLGVNGGSTYIFKLEIVNLGPKPTTGATTISYVFPDNATMTTNASTSNRMATITNLSSSVALTGLTTSTSDKAAAGCTSKMEGYATSEDGTKYADLQFTITTGYTFSPSEVSFKWRGNSNALKAKISVFDGAKKVTSAESTSSSSKDNTNTFSFAADAFDDVTFTGTVHIRFEVYSETSGRRAYLEGPYTITGTVAASAPAATYSVTLNPAGGSIASYDGWTLSDDVYMKSGISSGSSVALLALTKSGYRLNGWKDGENADYTSPVTVTGDLTLTAQWAQEYAVSFAAGDHGTNTMDPVKYIAGETVELPDCGFGSDNASYVFDKWTISGVAGTTEGAPGDEFAMPAGAVTVTAQWREIVNRTITLDANGGSVASYDGWTKEGDVYSKTVTEGTEVPLLAFTKAGVQLMFFRDGSANEYSSSVTLNADLDLKAVWGEEKEVEIYYWEGKEGGAIERGGTAVSVDKDGNPTTGNADVNASVSTYYTIRVQGKYDYSNPYVKITTDESVKTGDKITFTGFINKNQEKDAAMLMKAGDKELFAETTSLPNIAYPTETPGTPEEREYTISTTNVDATVLDLMRNNGHSGTNCFVTKIAITGTRVEEVKDPAATPSITGQPTGASYTWKETVAALTVTATVSDGGTRHYQWYKEAGETDTKVGTDAASYTPTESGTYYVVVTNKKSGYADASATSNNAVVTISARPSYTVTYYDGASSVGTESVQEDAYPTEYAAKQAKVVYGITGLYEFAGWFNNSDLAPAHAIANIATLAITGNTDIYGKWTRIEAEDVNLATYASENLADDQSTAEELAAFQTWFTGKGYVYANLNALDKTTSNNGAYAGLKTKSTSAYYAFNVPADKRVTIKLGYMASAAEMYINGVKNESQALTGGSTSSGDNYADWIYDTDAASTFKLQIKNSGTCVLKAITIGDKPALSDDVSLGSLTYQLGEADPVNIAIVANQTTYNVALPFKTPLSPVAVIAATGNHNGTVGTITQPLSNENGTATFTVTAEDGEHSENYTINLSIAPKEGASLIKVATTGGSNKTVTGYYAGDGDVNLSSSKKMDGGKYIGFTMEGMTLQAGDKINVHTTAAANTGGSHIIFYDNMTDKNELYETGEIGGTGNNIFTINAAMIGASTIYVYRSDADAAHKWNGYVDYLEATRVMNPVLTAITIDGSAGELDELVDNQFNVELPYESELANLTIVPTIIRNAAHATTPEAVVSNEGAWVIGNNTYRVMDKDGDYTDYTIALTRALPDAETPEIATDLTNHSYCAGSIPELDATANAVSDGGTVTYQWYNAEGAIEGATNAKYTPEGEGSYYCVLTNSLAEHKPATATSATAVLTQKAVTSISGETSFDVEQGAKVKMQPTITGEEPTYAWYACDAEGNHEGEALGTSDSYTTAALNDLGTYYYVLEVTAECGNESQIFTINVLDLGSSLVAHRPGHYYGQTLKVYDGRSYEIFGFASSASNSNFLWAGVPTTSSTAQNCVLAFNTSGETTWLSNSVNGRGSSYSSITNADQFNNGSCSGYKMHYRAANTLILKVKGYDQFSMYTKDNSASSGNEKYLEVIIDGVVQKSTANTSWAVHNFDLTDGEHVIIVRGNANSSSSNNEFSQFSLRLPVVAQVGETEIISVQDAIDNATDPITITMLANGYEDIVIDDTKDVTIVGGGHTLNSLTVKNGGKVNTSSALAMIENLVVEATMAGGKSGQIINGENLSVSGDVYFDITLGAGATSAQWHAFTVPFPVDAINGVYDVDGNKLTNEVNYAIMEYLGDVRATGAYGWKKYRKTLVPGTFYIMTVDGDRTTYRFKKTAGGAIVADDSKAVYEYAYSGEGTSTDAGWNGIGNPTLQYGKVNAEVQVLDPTSYTFVKKDANSTNFVVGTPFFYQASGDGSISMLEANASATYAPRRSAAKKVEKIKVAFGNETFTDYLDISASEDATNNYQIGKDLAKMIMTSTPNVAQIYGKANNTNLCMIHAPLTNDKAEFKTTLYVPTAGEYTMSAPATEDADVYLTKDGMIIWNLTMSECTLTLDKGFTTGYGLLLVKKAPQVSTGVENTEAQSADIQKVIIDNHVFILRGGKMYGVDGKEVK